MAFHIAVSALAACGLARRLGWQFYLVASLLHGAVNYSMILLHARLPTSVQVEIYIAVLAVLITTIALGLRRHEPKAIRQEAG